MKIEKFRAAMRHARTSAKRYDSIHTVALIEPFGIELANKMQFIFVCVLEFYMFKPQLLEFSEAYGTDHPMTSIRAQVLKRYRSDLATLGLRTKAVSQSKKLLGRILFAGA